MKRIGLAGFIHETNTFSNTPTPVENFFNQSGFYPKLLSGNEIFQLKEGRQNFAASGFMHAAEQLNFEIIPFVWCGSEPSQPLSQSGFDQIMGLIMHEIRSQQPFDGIFLDLHGAMVYGDLQDGETEILKRIRSVVGDIPIVTSFDLHGNISQECFNLASAMVGYRTYPHIDGFENGQRCVAVMQHLLSSQPFFKSFRQSPFLMPATTQPTTIEPAKSLYATLDEVDRWDGVLSASIMEGFNACDLPHTGPTVFSYATNQEIAEQSADFLLDQIKQREAQFTVNMVSPETAVATAMQIAQTASQPVILVDVQDNAGGGSPSDTVWILNELIRKNAKNAAVGVVWDPQTAAAAHQAGEGSEVELELGGHSLPGHTPLKSTFKVIKLHEGDFLGTGPMVKGRNLNLGKMAHVCIGDIHIVVSSDRMQALDQSLFRIVGIEPDEMSILVLKSANHYRADFGPIACRIINVDAPSAIIEDPSKIPYTNLRDGVRLKGLGPIFHKK